jgi:hypothetical protein
MTTPAFRAVAAQGRRLTMLASSAGAALRHHLPGIDEALVYEAARSVIGRMCADPPAAHAVESCRRAH